MSRDDLQDQMSEVVLGDEKQEEVPAQAASVTAAGFYMEVMDDAMAEVLRQKTEVERLRIMNRMWTSARVILRGAIQTEHPDWSVDQVNGEIAQRISHGVVDNGTK